MRSLERNPRLLCAFHGLQMSLFPVAVITLFWQRNLGMSMHEILLLQGLFGLTIAVFEFPSGYLADRLGYRRSLLLGSALQTVGWGAYCFADDFWGAAAAEAILGLGIALISGTDAALMFESLKETGAEGSFRRWDGRFRFVGQMSEGIAALFAGLLFAVDPRLPFALEVVVWLAAIGVAWKMVEPARHLPEPGGHLRRIASMLKTVLGGNRRLASIVCLTVLLGMSSFVPVWLVPLYASDAGVPDQWLGPMWAAANFVVAIASLSSDRVVGRFGLLPTLFACVVLVATGYLGLALSFGTFGFLFYFCLTLERGLFGPALLHEEQKLLPSADRAGFLSLRSLLFRALFLVIGPAIGAAVDVHGQHSVILIVGVGMTSATLLAWLWVRAERHSAAPA
jgi:MFS family permease